MTQLDDHAKVSPHIRHTHGPALSIVKDQLPKTSLNAKALLKPFYELT